MITLGNWLQQITFVVESTTMKQTLYMHKDLSEDEVKTRLRSEGTRSDTKGGSTSINLIQGNRTLVLES